MFLWVGLGQYGCHDQLSVSSTDDPGSLSQDNSPLRFSSATFISLGFIHFSVTASDPVSNMYLEDCASLPFYFMSVYFIVRTELLLLQEMQIPTATRDFCLDDHKKRKEAKKKKPFKMLWPWDTNGGRKSAKLASDFGSHFDFCETTKCPNFIPKMSQILSQKTGHLLSPSCFL